MGSPRSLPQPARPSLLSERGGFAPEAAPAQLGALRSRSRLTFLGAAGSALPGALLSKKLRLLATPSEESRRLFWAGTEDFTPSERCERERRQQG